MDSGWFDSLTFATTCLGGGGLLLSLWLRLAPTQRTLAALAGHTLVGVAALAVGFFALVAWTYGQPLALWGSAATLFALYFLLVAVPSPAFGEFAVAAVRLGRHRRGRLSAMFALWVFCPFFAIGLVYWQLDVPAELTDLELAWRVGREETHEQPKRNENTALATDRGRAIATVGDLPGYQSAPTSEMLAEQKRVLEHFELQDAVIHLPVCWQNCNCHGFVFTGGRYSISGSEVEAILADNDYQPIVHVHPGDLVVYRDAGGLVVHSGIVRGMASDDVILVESKWGKLGCFIHRHDRHVYTDSVCTFYRSPRPGHLVRGSGSGDSPIYHQAAIHSIEDDAPDVISTP